ncbi:MAG: asparagine synthase (glutamine-hydrolyzing) [Planctomycetota bacterium]
MCGILGVVFRDPRELAQEQTLTDARDTMTHRGPDEAGLWVRPGVGLAHRRLSILDLKHGQQPMLSDDQRYALTYNGEVYNYRELMGRYRERGLRFDTRCDTELVFRSLIADGPDAIEQYHGMFGLGFYDTVDRRLLLVRDRLGQKPVYWIDTGESLVFASELKAILIYTGGKYGLDPAALEQFFTRGYVLSPRTIFQGIHKLPAGCLLRLDANDWRIEVEPWWDATPMHADELGPLNDEAVLDMLDELLSQSVADRLIADVPIGTLLSGGIDSSLITAMASKARGTSGGGGVKAFTIGFNDSPAHDETPYARMVAEQYGCDWRVHTISQDEGDWLAELDDASRFYDEPFGNFTVTSQRTLSRLCREDLTVVLSGQGGDELSAGYPGRYNWVLQTEQAAANAQARSRYAPPVDDVVNHLNKTSFLLWPTGPSRMFSDNVKEAIAEAREPDEAIGWFWQRHHWPDRLGDILYTDAKTNLPDYLVCIEERASMSHSLEARNPMLDHRVVRYMLSLPAQYKVRPGPGPMAKDGLQNKWLLHALAKRYLPSETFDRPKRGFTPPLQQWMARYAQRIAEVFRQTDELTAPLYSGQWRQYLRAGRYQPGATMAVYYSLVFALWVRRYADHLQLGTAALQSRQARGLAPETYCDLTTPGHQTFREQPTAKLTEARWFCQMLGNIKPKPDEPPTLWISGDTSGFYDTLAKRSGCTVTSNQPQALIIVGLPATLEYIANPFRSAPMILVFIPFAAAQQQAVNDALLQLNAMAPIQGHQAVPVGGDQGVLIARCARVVGDAERPVRSI